MNVLVNRLKQWWNDFRIPLIYIGISMIWIFISDNLLYRLIYDADTLELISKIKGIFFILVTASVLHYLVKQEKTLVKQSKMQLDSLVEELQDTIRHQQGMIFKFKEENGRFIHTLNDGELMYRLGVFPQMVIGKELVDFLPPEQAERKLEYYRRAWAGEEHVTYEGEFNGITYFASLRPIRRNGKVVEVIGSCVDITERKRMEEYLRKSEKLTVMGQLAAGVAHEIRNPLTTLKGFTQLLRSEGNRSSFHLDLMLSELDRINLIVNEFMFLAKPQPLNFREQDITILLNQVITLLNSQALIANVQIITDFEDGLPFINCNENQMKQVFINLLTNSIDAMPDGGYLFVKAVKHDDWDLLIQIRDTGCGIPEERLSLLGEPFYSTKEKGTGLGLMISYNIIKNHNGRIEVKSKINEGTSFDITLPIRKELPMAAAY